MSRVAHILDIARADRIDFDALEEALETATHPERVEATRRWGRPIQRRLYEQAQGRAVTLDQLVPTDTPNDPVHHWGKNTVAPGVDHFQKRFVKPADRSDVLYGYNESWYRFAACPGYYVAYEDEDTGEVVVDYRRLPEGEPPGQWPSIVPNWTRLGLVIFHGMHDRLRRVSDHVTIGRAYKNKPMNQYFVLVRED